MLVVLHNTLGHVEVPSSHPLHRPLQGLIQGGTSPKDGVYPYVYMDSWEKMDGTTLPSKDDFYIEGAPFLAWLCFP